MAIRKQNQHYVPQLYLRQFAYSKKSSFYIHAYDITVQKPFTTNIENIAAENQYNDVILDENFFSNAGRSFDRSQFSSNEPLTWENEFCNIENKSAPILNKLIDNMHPRVITNRDKTILSAFCASLIMRVPTFRSLIKNTTELARNQFQENLPPGILDLISRFDQTQYANASNHPLKGPPGSSSTVSKAGPEGGLNFCA